MGTLYLPLNFAVNLKATHSGILSQRIPWTMQSMGLQGVRHG